VFHGCLTTGISVAIRSISIKGHFLQWYPPRWCMSGFKGPTGHPGATQGQV
jgi:hypothetical protein